MNHVLRYRLSTDWAHEITVEYKSFTAVIIAAHALHQVRRRTNVTMSVININGHSHTKADIYATYDELTSPVIT